MTANTCGARKDFGTSCCSSCNRRKHPGRAQRRQHPRQSPPLRGRVERGRAAQPIGRSRGGRTAKIHALANDQGKPGAFILTPSDIALLQRLLLDRAYETDHLRKPLEALGTEAVIPSSGERRHPYLLDRIACRRHNVIERMFCGMKDWRRIATRYDSLARNFLSTIALVETACFWLT